MLYTARGLGLIFNLVFPKINPDQSLSLEINANNGNGWFEGQRISYDNCSQNGFHFACKNGHSEVVQLFLEEAEKHSFDLKAVDDYGSTGLHLACWEKQEDVIKVLIRSGIFDIEETLGVSLVFNDKTDNWQFDIPFCTQKDESGQLVIAMDAKINPTEISIEALPDTD